MKTIKLNKFKDCIVDENNVIVAERPHGLKDWQAGEELCRVFNESKKTSVIEYCTCEMPAKIKGENKCYRCKKRLN